MNFIFNFPSNRNTEVELPIRENATKIDLNIEWGDGETSKIQYDPKSSDSSLHIKPNLSHIYKFLPYFRNVLFDNINTGTGNIAIIQSGKISYYENNVIQGSSIDLNYGGFIKKTNGDTIFINKNGIVSGTLPTTVTIKITGTCLNSLGRSAFGYGEQVLEGQEFLKEINGDIKDLSTGVTDFDRFFEKAFFNCRGLYIANITSTLSTMNKKANDFFSHCFFGCMNLETVSLPAPSNGVECADSYLDYCFFNCYELENIHISALPSSVLHADFYLRGTFKGCHDLYVEVTVVNSNAISDSLGIPALPSKVEYASYFLEETFDDCIRLKYTPLIPVAPDSLNHIEYYLNKTFQNCINLTVAFGIPPLPRYFNINDIPIDPNDPSKIFYMGEFATTPSSGSIKYSYYYNTTDHKYYIQTSSTATKTWKRAVFRKNTGFNLYKEVEYDTFWREESRYKIVNANSTIEWSVYDYRKYLEFSDTSRNGFYTVIEGVPFTTTKEQDIIDIVDKKYETRTIQKAPVEMWKPDFYYDMGSKVYRKEQTNVTGIYELVCYYAIRGVQQYDFSITLVGLYDFRDNFRNLFANYPTSDADLNKEIFPSVKNQPWMFPWPDSYIGLSTLQLYPDYNTMWGGLDSNTDGKLQAIELWGGGAMASTEENDTFWNMTIVDFFKDPLCTTHFQKNDIITADTNIYQKNDKTNSAKKNARSIPPKPPSGWLALTFSGTDNNDMTGTHSLTLPIPDEASCSGEVRWGDGATGSLSPRSRTHYYSQDKQYTIMIKGYIVVGGGTGFSFATISDSAAKLIIVEGTMKATIDKAPITTLDAYFATAFENCENLETVNLTIPPITEDVKWFEGLNLKASNYLAGTFSGCSNLMNFSCSIPAIPEFLVETIKWIIPIVMAEPYFVRIEEYNGENGAWSGWHSETRYSNKNINQEYTFLVYHYIRYCNNYMEETFYKCNALSTNIRIPKLSIACMTAETYLSKTFCSTAISGGAFIPSLPEGCSCQDYCYRTYASTSVSYVLKDEFDTYPWEYAWTGDPPRAYGTQCFANCKQLTSPKYDDLDFMWTIIPPEYTENQPKEF